MRGIENESRILEVIMDDLPNHPQCPHGPMLLFKQKNRMFYACSACRDRKLCPFFVKYGDKVSEAHILLVPTERQKLTPPVNITSLLYKVKLLLKKGERVDYCHSCECLSPGDESEKHKDHDVLSCISVHHFTHPSELLKPTERDKKEAQYHFSASAVSVIMNIARKNKFNKLLCIGSPRVHECVNNSNHLKMKSLLLDIDTRFHSFYDKGKFCWYNSFNNFFFHEDSFEDVLKPFLQVVNKGGILLVLDPPFGGRMEPLGYSVNQMRKLFEEVNENHQNPPFGVMWVCPYFMEPYIIEVCPKMHMLDYKVYYENHPLFSKDSKSVKNGSPVRIFTDLPREKCELPVEEGYWFCPVCRQWSSQENKHCPHCDRCTSKNGTTYVHCLKCNRCVKPSWQHCDTCGRCCLSNHTCGTFTSTGVCYHCGGEGHRKNSCPQKQGNNTKRKKRKMSFESEKTINVKKSAKKNKIKRKKLKQ